MPKRVIAKLQRSVTGGAVIVGVASLASRVIGLIRDQLLTGTFGAGEFLDSYTTAFKIPDLIFNIIVLGVLSASFVPIFIEYRDAKGREEAFSIARSLLTVLGLGMTVLVVLAMVFAPHLVDVIAPGDSATQQETIVGFMRIMLIATAIFSVSNVLSGILHAERQFFVYSLAPLFYNLGIIGGIVLLVPLMGPELGLPLGVVLGAVLHAAILIPGVWKLGFRYRPTLQLRHPGVRELFRLMPPRAFALGLTQLNIVVLFRIISQFQLAEGSRAAWQYADNLQHVPITFFGVSLALSAFPQFSEAFAKKDMRQFKQLFSESFRRILYFVIPVAIGTLLLRAQVVRLVYGRGIFDWEDTIQTADVLGVFALSMWAQALIPLLARSFFAKKDTLTPVLWSLTAMVLNVTLGLLLVRPFGLQGLAFAFSLSAITQMLGLLVILRARHGDLDDDHLISSTWKILVASVGMGLVVQGLKYLFALFVDMQTVFGVLSQTVAAAGGGALVYLCITLAFHFDEADAILKRVKKTWSHVRRAWK